MSRSIYLADADAQGVKAKLENGVLTINVPKTQKSDTSIKIDID
jgi:HSP20 family protein